MSSNYTYKAFGLIIQSELEIPEFTPSNEIADVEITMEKVPEKLDRVIKKGVKYQTARDEFLLEVDHIAKYYVKNGNRISIETLTNYTDKEVRLFLLGSAFGALFLQRGLLPIHGSAIKFGNSACIFSGLSGVGKSSIAATLVLKGFQFLADDICVIDTNLNVVPGFPHMKIWKDILDNLEIKTDTLTEIRPEIKKYHLPVDDGFYNESLPLAKIFIINTKNTPGYEFEELKGLQKFNAVKNNTYRYRFVGGLDKQLDHFQTLNKLLPEIKVYRVSRPQSPIMLEEFADFLIKTFKLDA
ncbi:MAG: hypothetical protein AB7S50_15295 [Bacteroidales bacterium]